MELHGAFPHTHTHTHTHIYIFICIYMWMCVYIYISSIKIWRTLNWKETELEKGQEKEFEKARKIK